MEISGIQARLTVLTRAEVPLLTQLRRVVHERFSDSSTTRASEPPARTDRLIRFNDEGDPIVKQPKDEWARSPFERDRDRLLYSRELRRLKDVTQVARADESYLYHDRLSHSLKVAQVGHRLTELIQRRPRNKELEPDITKLCDPSVVEAACLAHDLGHPPFGHHSEQCIDKKVREKTKNRKLESPSDNSDDLIGYEGNAQSFRIVTQISDHYSTDLGFGLTRATLNAIQKYPRSRQEDDDKWGYYPTEERQFEFARHGTSHDEKCLEADIMDYADDLTYAIHDVIDFYMSGRIPLDRLFLENTERDEYKTNSSNETERFKNYLRENNKYPGSIEVEDLFAGLSDFPRFSDTLFDQFGGTPEERQGLANFRSYLVGRYLSDSRKHNPDFVWLGHDDNGKNHKLRRSPLAEDEIETLKQLTFCYVIEDSTLMAQQRGQKRLIEELYEVLYEEAGEEDLHNSAIPEPYVSWLLENPGVDKAIHKARIVADMIASMTEPQAVSLHKRLTGDSPGSLQDQLITGPRTYMKTPSSSSMRPSTP